MKFIAHGYQTEPKTDKPFLIIEHTFEEIQISPGVTKMMHDVKVLVQFATQADGHQWLEANHPGAVA